MTMNLPVVIKTRESLPALSLVMMPRRLLLCILLVHLGDRMLHMGLRMARLRCLKKVVIVVATKLVMTGRRYDEVTWKEVKVNKKIKKNEKKN